MPENGKPSIITFRGVTKRFGELAVLEDFNIDIEVGEHIALIGPSGSGKSTILRILMTLEDIQNGEIRIEGDPLWQQRGDQAVRVPEVEVRRIRQKVGMVFQNFNLFPHMTAIRNVAEAPMRVLKLSKDEAYDRAGELLKLVGLSGKQGSFPTQLSGGQQQRVAIARALAMRPKILLFDEVTSALDPETVGEVVNVIRMLAKEHDFTILLVTHQMELAREVAGRVCFFERGRILEQGRPAQIFDAPKSERTRAFLQAVLGA